MYQKSVVNPVYTRFSLGRERHEAKTQLLDGEKREMTGSQKVCSGCKGAERSED